MKHLVLSLLTCLAVGNGDSHAAEPAKIELRLLKSVTVTEEQFLLGAKDGQPVTLAVELRLPTAGTTRLPAMILLHGSAGAMTTVSKASGHFSTTRAHTPRPLKT